MSSLPAANKVQGKMKDEIDFGEKFGFLQILCQNRC